MVSFSKSINRNRQWTQWCKLCSSKSSSKRVIHLSWTTLCHSIRLPILNSCKTNSSLKLCSHQLKEISLSAVVIAPMVTQMCSKIVRLLWTRTSNDIQAVRMAVKVLERDQVYCLSINSSSFRIISWISSSSTTWIWIWIAFTHRVSKQGARTDTSNELPWKCKQRLRRTTIPRRPRLRGNKALSTLTCRKL